MGRDALVRIEKFNIERGMLDGDNPFNLELAYTMLREELLEFSDAGNEGDVPHMVEELNDLIIVAAGEILKLGFSPRLTLAEKLTEIESRTGAINPVTGKWQKKITGNEYKANYGACYND